MVVNGYSVNGGYTPDGKLRVFDTNTYNSSDPDMAAPNEMCSPDNPGPGKGQGGEPGRPGMNCEKQGNVLFIQNDNSEEPDDFSLGGDITFSFDCPLTTLLSIGLMDISSTGTHYFIITQADGTRTVRFFEGLGDNSVQDEYFSYGANDVNSVTIQYENSCGVRYICFCQDLDRCQASPTVAPPASPPIALSPSPPANPSVTQSRGGRWERITSRWHHESSYLARNEPLDDSVVGLTTLDTNSDSFRGTQWKLEDAGNGRVRIQSRWEHDGISGVYLTRTPGNQVKTLPLDTSNSSQLWVFENAGNAYWRIISDMESDSGYLTRDGIPNGTGGYDPGNTVSLNLRQDSWDSQYWKRFVVEDPVPTLFGQP